MTFHPGGEIKKRVPSWWERYTNSENWWITPYVNKAFGYNPQAQSNTSAGYDWTPLASYPQPAGPEVPSDFQPPSKRKGMRKYLESVGIPKETLDLFTDQELDINWEAILKDFRLGEARKRAGQEGQMQAAMKLANNFQNTYNDLQQQQINQETRPRYGESWQQFGARKAEEGIKQVGENLTPYANNIDAVNTNIARKQGQFEDWRSEILSTTQPSNWIIRARARNALNPYTGIAIPYYGVGNNESPNGAAYDPTANVNPQRILKNTGVGEMPKEVTGMLGGNKAWGAPVEIPSFPTWNTTPENTKQMIYPYMQEALGYQPADFLTAMRNMLPENPSRGTSWQPARSRR